MHQFAIFLLIAVITQIEVGTESCSHPVCSHRRITEIRIVAVVSIVRNRMIFSKESAFKNGNYFVS